MANVDFEERILQEVKEKRNKQDQQLNWLRRIAIWTLVVELSAGTVAVAVSREVAANVAVIVFGAAISLGIVILRIELLAGSWKDRPTISGLCALLMGGKRTHQQLLLTLIQTHREDHDDNSKTINQMKFWVLLGALIAFGAIAVLLIGFHELT